MIFTIDMGIYKTVVVDVIKTEPPAPKIPEIDLEKHINSIDADTEERAVLLFKGIGMFGEFCSNKGWFFDILGFDLRGGNSVFPKPFNFF